jgi:hypothetical protein
LTTTQTNGGDGLMMAACVHIITPSALKDASEGSW